MLLKQRIALTASKEHRYWIGRMESELLQGRTYLMEKSISYTTSVAVENDVVCGIEVAPCSSDAAGTLSTDPLSYSGSSNSLSTNPSDEILLLESVEISPVGIKVGKKLQAFASCMDSSIISSRVDDLFDVLDDINSSENAKHDPILELQLEYVEHDSGEEPADDDPEKPKTPLCSNSGLTNKAGFRLDTEFYNLLDPAPNNFFWDLMDRSHHKLCQVVLGALDVPFLFNKSRRALNSNGKTDIQTPFMMFPEKSRALVSLENNDNYIVSSSGPLNQAILTQLFGIQRDLGGRNVKVKSVAYRDGLPSMEGTEPVHLDSNKLELRLNEWKRGRHGRAKSEPDRNLSKHDKDEKYVVPRTSLIPLVAGHDKCDDAADLFVDEELKAFLKITRDGEEASPLFPSFSSDDISSVAFSDDGLGDELGALDNINDELRKELDFADVVINGSNSADSWQLKTRRAVKKGKALSKEPPLRDHIGTDSTVSATDSEPSPSDSSDTSEKSIAREGQRRVRFAEKRVHFADRHEEFVYHGHLPIIILEESSSDETRDGPEPWFGKLEDAYMVLEEMIDDLALSCTAYAGHSRKQPSSRTKTRASTAHYV
eukprot:scaffold3782_cov170-Amphora_coffeaeformis.AAC.9